MREYAWARQGHRRVSRGAGRRRRAREGVSTSGRARAIERWTSRSHGHGHACTCMQACKRMSDVQGRCWSSFGHGRVRTDMQTGVWSSEWT
ncbi:hypothetical protein CRG98_022760 [Punica granatum]|uniref:Uncharacterized protein n=1 Tax=Punica granatum TaxID=22663 RepID=A0A2I0JKL1_PUNGR|nr:hypothetical protein CRG98_022760 [Punica granatum]